MREAIICRIRFALWLLLFAAPLFVAIWGQGLDRTMADNSFIPAPDAQIAIAQTDSSQF